MRRERRDSSRSGEEEEGEDSIGPSLGVGGAGQGSGHRLSRSPGNLCRLQEGTKEGQEGENKEAGMKAGESGRRGKDQNDLQTRKME